MVVPGKTLKGKQKKTLRKAKTTKGNLGQNRPFQNTKEGKNAGNASGK